MRPVFFSNVEVFGCFLRSLEVFKVLESFFESFSRFSNSFGPVGPGRNLKFKNEPR